MSKVTLENDLKSNQVVLPMLKKYIVYFFSQEICESIIQEIGDHVFILLVDKSSIYQRKKK